MSFGIDNIKKLIAFPVELGNIAANILEDGDTGWKRWLKIAYAVPEGFELLKIDWTKLKSEYENLDEAERGELLVFMKERFNIPDHKSTEEIIENSFSILFNLEACARESIKLFKSLKG